MDEGMVFIGYERREDNLVAKFETGYPQRPITVFAKSDLEIRLRNLQEGGWPCDQTEMALRGWPASIDEGA